MKTAAKKAIRDEKGKVMILVLVLLVVGGLILTPLLDFMSTGLVAGQVYERKTAELYAADAGVEDAIWKIQNDKAEFDENGYYSYPDPEQGVADLWVVNDRNVDVEIYRADIGVGCHKEYRYQILSTGTGIDGSATTIEAFLTSVDLDYSGFLGNAITSGGDVTIRPKGTVLGEIWGDISLPPDGALDPESYVPEVGEVKREELIWPTAEELSAWYWKDVKDAAPYPSLTLDVKDYAVAGIGPFCRDGDLDIVHTGAANLTLKLSGTVYITGDVTIGNTNHDFTLDLDGNTIFVESNSTGLEIGGKCTIKGPGAIIAVGDIYFAPAAQTGGKENPVFILSVSGTTRLQPIGNFYGSIAGNAEVHVQPNNTIIHPAEGFGEINFPGFIEGKETYSIESWQIK